RQQRRHHGIVDLDDIERDLAARPRLGDDIAAERIFRAGGERERSDGGAQNPAHQHSAVCHEGGRAYCGPPRIEAGWPGSLKRPASVSLSPLTFMIDRSWSIKLPT